MKLFLCGFSGAGKTTLGEKLSRSDVFQVFDLDDEIFNRMGSGHDHLGEYIEEIGLDEFRKDELSVLKMLHQNFKDNYLVILGGGTLENSDSLEFIKSVGGKLIYLENSFESCFERIKNSVERPLVKKGRAHLEALYKKREPLHQKAECVISQDQALTIQHIDDLLALLN